MTDKVIAFLWPEADFRAAGLAVPAGFSIRFGRAAVRAEAEAACDGADYIVAASGMGMIDAALLGLAPRARLVQLTGAGYDNVDYAECARRGIPVCHVPGLNAPSVAQLVVQFAFRLKRPLRLLATGGEEEWLAARAVNVMGEEVSGRVGVVGYGNIGRQIAKMFSGLGLEVVRAERAGQDDEVLPLPLDELLASADIVAVALPARADTRGLIDAARIARIRPGAVLIHVGRGGVVDEGAVARALAEGRLAGAAFDVFESEPLPPDHPFLALPEPARARLLLTPHIGGQTLQSKARNFRIALDNVRRVENGEAPLYRAPPSAA
jgi:phosphoglycerate dehydrogenase-like enzyme